MRKIALLSSLSASYAEVAKSSTLKFGQRQPNTEKALSEGCKNRAEG